MSRPARGVWIETYCSPITGPRRRSRPARGVWIETDDDQEIDLVTGGHAPRGACGLKHNHQLVLQLHRRSRPARGVWIETQIAGKASVLFRGHAPRGACGLKHRLSGIGYRQNSEVTPRAGRVD